MYSVFVGGLALGVIAFHVVKIIRRGRRCHTEHQSQFPWKIHGRQDMLFLLVVMPSVFILMSLRSTSRMWYVMTGKHTGEDAVTDLALFKENFELAAVCQYYLVHIFAQLCIDFLTEQEVNKDMETAIRYAGFQGAYAWCVIGSVHSVILFGLAYSHNFNLAPVVLLKVEAVEKTVSILASFMSIMCTYNMFIICKLPFLEEALGHANMKFNGTKVMLLVGPNQLKVLLALAKLGFLDLSEQRAMLLHSSLISAECLLVTLLNFFAWEVLGQKDKFFGKAEGYYQPLDE